MKQTNSALATTTNSRVYKIVLKFRLMNTGEIHCNFCPYHRRENYTRKDYRCWKRHRKTQYRIVGP